MPIPSRFGFIPRCQFYLMSTFHRMLAFDLWCFVQVWVGGFQGFSRISIQTKLQNILLHGCKVHTKHTGTTYQCLDCGTKDSRVCSWVQTPPGIVIWFFCSALHWTVVVSSTRESQVLLQSLKYRWSTFFHTELECWYFLFFYLVNWRIVGWNMRVVHHSHCLNQSISWRQQYVGDGLCSMYT